MKRFCILTAAVTLMLGCSGSGLIERGIGVRVDGCEPNASCVIRVADLTDFRWDQMHVFTPGAGHPAADTRDFIDSNRSGRRVMTGVMRQSQMRGNESCTEHAFRQYSL
jgi:hypothetical protein